MKTKFVTTFFTAGLMIAFIAFLFATCKKDTLETQINQPQTTQGDNYSSMSDFFAKNGVPMQTYSINASTGGSFTTPQGTRVTIPAGAFAPVGLLNIQFKDVYKKSDMLLSSLSTTCDSAPLKSAGMFFIKATYNGSAIDLDGSFVPLSVQQPFGGLAADSNMQPFVATFNPQMDWSASGQVFDSLIVGNASDYVFSLFNFNYPLDSGTWCNSDNQTYFASYPNTILTMHPTDNPDTFYTNVFLIFKNIDCMIHVYKSGNNFPYNYAPQGLECTVVAIGEKGGKLFSSFTPITIGSNQTVNFTLSETTTAAFKAALKLLD